MVSSHVKSLYKRHLHLNTRPTVDELTEALKIEISTYARVFLVIDALDECPQNGESGAQFLHILRSLRVNLLLTARDIPLIARKFRGINRLEIRAKKEDIKKYIEGRLSLDTQLRLVLGRNTGLQLEMVNNVAGNVHGM